MALQLSKNLGVANATNPNVPLDCRLVVSTLTNLTSDSGEVEYPYIGQVIYCVADGKYYKVKALSTNKRYATEVEIFQCTKVVDNLTSSSNTDALSANQGKVLLEKITELTRSVSLLTTRLSTAETNIRELQQYVRKPTSVEYAPIVINLSYPTIPAAGGTVTPTLSYLQMKKTTWSDGTETTENITSGATVTYSGASHTDGSVTAPKNTDTLEKTVATVTVTVSLNGRSNTKTVQVKQEASTEVVYNYYVGNVDGSASAFTALADTTLTESATKKSTLSSDESITATKKCIYLLIPTSKLKVSKFEYGPAGMKTDVIALDLWNLNHDDITVDGETYKVYGYRSGGISDSDPLTITYRIEQK